MPFRAQVFFNEINILERWPILNSASRAVLSARGRHHRRVHNDGSGFGSLPRATCRRSGRCSRRCGLDDRRNAEAAAIGRPIRDEVEAPPPFCTRRTVEVEDRRFPMTGRASVGPVRADGVAGDRVRGGPGRPRALAADRRRVFRSNAGRNVAARHDGSARRAFVSRRSRSPWACRRA